MKSTLNVEDFYNVILEIARLIHENKKYLTDLDSAIGDADHGINMDRGFSVVIDKVGKMDINNSDIGSLLILVSNTLMETVGGAAGPLYGMFFMNMANKAMGKREVDYKEFADMLEDGLKGVQEIGGGTQPGEKTMVDTLYPAINAFKRGVERGDIEGLKEVLLREAENGMKSTINMVAKKGRASYLGERSLGHQDLGATSCYLILKAFYDHM